MLCIPRMASLFFRLSYFCMCVEVFCVCVCGSTPGAFASVCVPNLWCVTNEFRLSCCGQHSTFQSLPTIFFNRERFDTHLGCFGLFGLAVSFHQFEGNIFFFFLRTIPVIPAYEFSPSLFHVFFKWKLHVDVFVWYIQSVVAKSATSRLEHFSENGNMSISWIKQNIPNFFHLAFLDFDELNLSG